MHGGMDAGGVSRVSVDEAKSFLDDGHRYLDVRTVAEFEAGHVPGALNVPVMVSGPGGMVPNADFGRVAAAVLAKDAAIVVGCKTGARSQRACAELSRLGFSGLVELRTGWDGCRDAFGQLEPGWSRRGLPVETGDGGDGAYAVLLAKA